MTIALRGVPAAAAPAEWKDAARTADDRLHQLAPYIGKLKPVIARTLIEQFSSSGDLVLDCFSGSGTIPLEASLLGRRVLACDSNPYAVTLTRAKLEAPTTIAEADGRLAERLAAAYCRPRYREDDVPSWVRKFFHPETLQNLLRFADQCIEEDDQFLLACLLSILHHQRPGFLSYPSSHLVPYLRDRKFPRMQYPEMYCERDVAPRLAAKVRRLFKGRSAGTPLTGRVAHTNITDLRLDCEVDAIITSPPYMNALDYVRDNRLRMWILDRSTVDYSPEPTEKRTEFDAITAAFARNALSRLRRGGYCVLVVGETVRRKRMTSHPADQILSRLFAAESGLQLRQVIQDVIPDVRRTRRAASATKRELILVLQKA